MSDLITDVETPAVPAVEVVPPAVAPVIPAAVVPTPTPNPVPVHVAPATPSVEDLLKSNPELQALLNKITGDARKEGREKGKKEILESAGVDDPAKIKALFDAEKARQEAEMTATQRLESQLATLAAEKQAAIELVKVKDEQMKRNLLRGEIEKQATALNFIDVFDLKSRLDNATIEIDLETGNVSGVAEQAKAIAANAKHLIKQPSPNVAPNTNVPATPKPASPQAQASATDEEKRRKAWRPR